MDAQLEYSRLLHDSGHGIALRKPSQDIDVGDLCYWSPEGKAVRILNVFDNRQWLNMQHWPPLNISKEEVLDESTDVKLQIVHAGGLWWGISPSYTNPPGFDLYFQRLATDLAVLVPSSPTKIIGLRPAGRHVLEQWWSQAKRHVFRTWSYLLNSPTGIFLVTKCIKAHRVAQSLSKGPRGQISQIQIHGMPNIPQSTDNIELPSNRTAWQLVRNDLAFEIHDAGRNPEYTIFIERDSCRMFTVTDVGLRDAAQRLWNICTAPPAPPPPPAPPIQPWLASSHPGWNNQPPPGVPWPPNPNPPPNPQRPNPNSPAATAIFDGKDRLALQDGWFLIRGGDAYFLEHCTTGLDSAPSTFNVEVMTKVLKGREKKPPQQQQQQQQPPNQGVHPPPYPAVNPPPLPPLPIPPGQMPPQGQFYPPGPIGPPPQGGPPLGGPPLGGQPLQMPNPMIPPNGIPGPAIPMGQHPPHPPPQPAINVPGVIAISPPLPPNLAPIPAAAIGAQPITPPKLPETSIGAASVMPCYDGFAFVNTAASAGAGNGPPVIHVNPPGTVPPRVPGLAGMDIPWGWNS